jgi:hypothetical protein
MSKMKSLKLINIGLSGIGLGFAYLGKVSAKGDPAKDKLADQAIEMGKERIKRALEL